MDTDRNHDVTPPKGDGESSPGEICDVCGSDRVIWRKCKLVCLNCGTILKSCADL